MKQRKWNSAPNERTRTKCGEVRTMVKESKNEVEKTVCKSVAMGKVKVALVRTKQTASHCSTFQHALVV